jgi:predicted HicB family RNase H-like nuclease
VTTATVDRDMARKRDKPEKAERKDEPVRIDSEVLRIARIVASFEELSLTDYISSTLRPIVDRDFARHVKKHAGKIDPPPDR